MLYHVFQPSFIPFPPCFDRLSSRKRHNPLGIRELDVSGSKIPINLNIYLVLSAYVNLNIRALLHNLGKVDGLVKKQIHHRVSEEHRNNYLKLQVFLGAFSEFCGEN